MIRILSVVTFLMVLTHFASAQSFYAARRDRSLLITGGAGTSTYFGELTNQGDYIDAKPTLNVGLQYYLTDRISTRAEITWFTLEGDDAKATGGGREFRNLSFKSNNYEVNLSGTFNLFSNGDRYYRRPIINIYGFLGLGFIYFNPTTTYQGETIALQPLQTEGVNYSRFGIVIPYGLGGRLKLTPMLNLSVEGGLRKTFTDHLDDVSSRDYPDPASLSSDLSRTLSKRGTTTIRGNPESLDAYMLVTAKLEYYLPTNFLFKNSRSGYQKSLYKNKRNSFNRANKKFAKRNRRRR
jgi:hypothetical protein